MLVRILDEFGIEFQKAERECRFLYFSGDIAEYPGQQHDEDIFSIVL